MIDIFLDFLDMDIFKSIDFYIAISVWGGLYIMYRGIKWWLF